MFGLRNQKDEVLKQNSFVDEAGKREDQQFSLGHLKFEISIRSPSGDVEHATEYMSSEFEERYQLKL